ncbi:MAG: GAF domain-containing sensor histidine kinase [Anaerolineales bacterium]|uniref:GAF domain-containing sensor histidine kinase n=1 Tax=Promineifilum sp. TaxID=2664178 RepID=UPI001DA5259C|nr:GAF domain-containing sensor histidine kinase [Anaerolineales bacterium]MCB8935037.1 GAF domain-containing sensor histidine kinase [Promineifilum sp.]MCO5181003.1 GAF domain-containing sensor histidine kinase [Promineifilum sp.]
MSEENPDLTAMAEPSAQRALEALNQAALAIASELDVDKVLQLIVDSARDLVGAKYAALAVGDWRVPGSGNVHRFVVSGMARDEIKKISHWPLGRGLLGAVIHGQQAVRVEHINQDKRSVGMPAGHPPMEGFLGVPIVGAGETLGNLYLTDKLGDSEFNDADQHLIEMLAAHAAVAIQNARLYSQVERLAILEERTRIGMDLHDGVIQSIYAVGLTLESTRLALPDDSDEVATLLDTAVEGLNDAIRDIRNFILDLRPRRFAGDVQQGLAQLVREFQANTMVPVSVAVPDRLDDLPLPQGRAIFLTTQEALANVARHARASKVDITLHCTSNQVTLSIQDNGRGFDSSNESLRVGHGLANMQARAEGLHGAFDIRSSAGLGTVVILELPL